MATGSFYNQISANKRNSLFMALAVIAVLGVLGFAIGYGVVGDPAGGVGATGLALGFGAFSGVASYFAGDKLVLTVSGAREVDDRSAPQLTPDARAHSFGANDSHLVGAKLLPQH